MRDSAGGEILVFATQAEAPPLAALAEALQEKGHPATVTPHIAGEATEEELSSGKWEAVFIRWMEPEVHEIVYLERGIPGDDAEADSATAAALQLASESQDAAGALIVAHHVRRTRCVYAFQILPALKQDEDHAAWGALDALIQRLAAETDGMIYVRTEGFCGPDGELLLQESEDFDMETDTESEQA